MLDPCGPFRKNSFRAGRKNLRNAPVFQQLPQFSPRGGGQKTQAGGGRKRRVAQEGAAHTRTEGPARVGCDRRQRLRLRLRPHGGLQDIRFGREAVVQEGRDDARVRIEPEDGQNPPPRRPGQVDPFGKRHFGETAEEVAVGRAAHFGMDPHVRRKVREVPPEESGDERQSLSAGSAPVPGETPAHDVEAPRRPVIQDLLESLPGEIAAGEQLQDRPFPAHFEYRLHQARSFFAPGSRRQADARAPASRATASSAGCLSLRASSAAPTRAEPTTTPPAGPAARAAAAGVETPNPIASGSAGALRRARRTVSASPAGRASRAPVIPERETTYRKPVESLAAAFMRASVDVGETRKMVSRPAAVRCGGGPGGPS